MGIDTHNQEHEEGKHTYTVAVNQFADWTSEEYSTYVTKNGLLPKRSALRNARALSAKDIMQGEEIAQSVDWTTKGAVTPVKDQAQCGSCWAFSTTGSTEGAHFVESGELLSFAEQQLVDCDKVDHGCGGGLMDNAFKFFEEHKVILEKDYPYTAKNGTCKESEKTPSDVEIKKFTDVPKESSEQLKAAIEKQPVSVAIEADKPMFHYYASG